jgi:pilus assembly protein CpaE
MTQPRIAAVGGNAAFVPLVARVLGSSPDDLTVINSVASAERAIAEGDRLFDVVVLGPTVAEKDAASLAEFVSKEVPTTAVIVVRDAPVDGAFSRLVRSGARDVVDISGGGTELREALMRAVDWAEGIRGKTARAEEPKSGEGAIVAIFSTKGGTGKTFFSCNLAAALAERTGKKVGLVDLDHDLGDVFAYFGASPKRSLPDLLLLEEGADPDEVTRLGTPLIDGVIGFGSTPDPRAEPLPSGAVTRMLRTLKDTFPFTVVDATSEYSDHVLAAFDLADAICLISGLDAIGIRHMTMGMQTLDRLGVPRDRVKIVLNRADSKVDLTPEDVEKLLGLTVDARIPSSSLVPRSINRAQLVFVEERRSDVAKAIEVFADRLRSQFSTTTAEPSANGTKRRLWKKG